MTDPHSIPLLPCPFCGHPAQIVTAHNPCQVGCFNPKCGVHPKARSTCEDTAIRHWNQRNAGVPPAASESDAMNSELRT